MTLWPISFASSSLWHATGRRVAAANERAFSVYRVVLVFVCLLPSLASGDTPGIGEKIDFDIPPQRADLALTRFAEQADLTLVFPFDNVRERTANRLVGRYTLEEAIDVLLAGTGLIPTLKNRVVLDIAIDNEAIDGEHTMNATKKAGLIAVLGGILAGGAAAAESAQDARVVEETGIVTGKVVDARTGANLKGAKVTIEETGQWTSTNDLGEFRLVNVPTGSATLAVSYLGYAGQSAVVGVRGDGTSQDFALRGGSAMEEIVVFGQRSARALALNQERTAENSTTVISSDLIGQFTGSTIAEVLRRTPGVTFNRESRDGSGTNIIIRGLEPDLNAVTLNGVELTANGGRERAPSLGNILADSVGRVVINKTLLPNQDSAGTGGLVEIETRKPLDRDRRFASFSYEQGESDGDFLENSSLSGILSGKFGEDDQFGLSVSAQFATSDAQSLSYSNEVSFGQHLPLDAQGLPVANLSFIDPRSPFPFESSAGDVYARGLILARNDFSSENLTISVDGQWRIKDHTNLTFSYVNIDQESNSADRSFSLTAFPTYFLQPIPSLGGEQRYGLEWSGFAAGNSTLRLTGDVEAETNVLSFEGSTSFGSWTFGYSAGYTDEETQSPDEIFASVSPSVFVDPSLVLPSATDPVEGRVITLFGQRTGEGPQLPLLTQAGFAAFNDPNNYGLSFAQNDGRIGGAERTNIAASSRYDFPAESALKYFEIGASYESTEFGSDFTTDEVTILFGTGDSIVDLGLDLASTDLSSIGGGSTGFNVVSARSLRQFQSNIPSLIESGALGEFTFSQPAGFQRSATSEDELALYVQGAVQFGDLEIIGGLRFSRYEIETNNFLSPTLLDANGAPILDAVERLSDRIDETASQTELLPRVLFNYRPREELVVRGGYYRSLARPQVSQISSAQSISLDLQPISGLGGDQPILSISSGNPDLKPAVTDNFDLGVELYDKDIGVMKLNVFYKDIGNFISNNVRQGVDSLSDVNLPDDPVFENLPGNLFIVGSIPLNDDSSAEIWGVEGVFEKQFTSLPGIYSGLGVLANFTWTDSSKSERVSFNGPDGPEEVVVNGVDFAGQSPFSATVAALYNKFGFDASLSYTYQDQSASQFGTFGLGQFIESNDSLDLRAEYRFQYGSADCSLFFEGLDLLKDSSEPAFQTGFGGEGRAPSVITSGTYLGGRTFRIGARATF